MTTFTLMLDPEERQFLARSIGAEDLWPSSEAATSLLSQVPGGDVAGGPRLRVLLLAMDLRGPEEPMPLPVSVSELWLIDSLLLRCDLRREKLSDGRPLIEFAMKVWRLLLDAYEEELPQHLQKETANADEDNPHDTDAYVAAAEAILRSRHGPGAGEDLPPAAP